MQKWLKRRSFKTLAVATFVALGIAVALTYFTYTFHPLIWKSLTAAAAIVFSFLFWIISYVAIDKTSLAKKKARGFVLFLAFLSIIGIYILASYLIGTTDILLLLPLSEIILYWLYILGNFVEIEPSDTEEVKLHLKNLKRQINQRMDFMLLLVFVLTALPLLFFRGILPIPPTFGALYDVGLSIYAVIFSVVTAFGVLGLAGNQTNSLNRALRRPLLGLAHMCVAFFLLSVVGKVLGTDVGTAAFATGTTLGKAFSLEPLGVGVFRLLLIESVIISFPFTLIYLYIILRTFLLGSPGEPYAEH